MIMSIDLIKLLLILLGVKENILITGDDFGLGGRESLWVWEIISGEGDLALEYSVGIIPLY